MSTRRLAIGVVAIAAILLGGRALSVLYDSFTWYDSLGAGPLWTERAIDSGLVYGIGFIVAATFALLNFIAVGGAIGSLIRPRRLANVEFGEAVPPSQLRAAAVAASVAVGIVLARLLPSWKTVALARLGVDFREADPYLHHDLSFYVAWLPLERALYSWTFALLVSVSVLVLATYVFASGIRWNGGLLQMTARVRRHLGVLVALLLLLFTWSYRLDSYELLSSVGRDGAVFGYFEHQWMLPGLLGLALATAAAAITVAISAWMGQLRTSLIAIMFAIGLAAIVHEVIPFVFSRSTSASEEAADNAPYLATRADFTRRAFGTEIESAETENSPFAALSSLSAGSVKARDSLVAPGASGMQLVDDPTLDVAGPSLGTGLRRLAHAWAARRFGLLADSIHRRARIVTVRDVRDRVTRLYPLFFTGQALRPLFRADTLYWSVALYSSSAAYPLGERREISGETRSYFHRAGTAFVNARTGRVLAALDIPAEPVAEGWIRNFESTRSLAAAQVLQRSLSAGTSANAVAGGLPDTTFRTQVIRLYERMRSALSAGDLRGFGLAYDSLGALVGRTRK